MARLQVMWSYSRRVGCLPRRARPVHDGHNCAMELVYGDDTAAGPKLYDGICQHHHMLGRTSAWSEACAALEDAL